MALFVIFLSNGSVSRESDFNADPDLHPSCDRVNATGIAQIFIAVMQPFNLANEHLY